MRGWKANAPLKEEADLAMRSVPAHARGLEHIEEGINWSLPRNDVRAHVGEDDPLPPWLRRLRRQLVQPRPALRGRSRTRRGNLGHIPRPTRDIDRAGDLRERTND